MFFEDFEEFLFEFDVNDRQRDMVFKVIIFELILICIIILSFLFFGFSQNKFPVAIKDVSKFINISALSLELLYSLIVRDTGWCVNDVNPCISLVTFDFAHNS